LAAMNNFPTTFHVHTHQRGHLYRCLAALLIHRVIRVNFSPLVD